MLAWQRCALLAVKPVLKLNSLSNIQRIHTKSLIFRNSIFRNSILAKKNEERKDHRMLSNSRSHELSDLTVKELSQKLRELGLPVTGRKSQLIERLTQHAPQKKSRKASVKKSKTSANSDLTDADAAEALLYEKKSPVEHILLRPDSYVGSISPTDRRLIVYDFAENSLQYRDIRFIPAVLKIFDEILVNAADNKQRDPKMSRLDVQIESRAGKISILNDGCGIPVVKHPKHAVYVPELIMGNLLTGSNFDDTKSRVTGGRHGYGAKLTNIFSKSFTVETGDTTRGLVYRQTWRNNMSVCEPPEMWDLEAGQEDYTCITFEIDLRRFGLSSLDRDTLALFGRRVLDVAGCMPSVRCTINDQVIKVVHCHKLYTAADSHGEQVPSIHDLAIMFLTAVFGDPKRVGGSVHFSTRRWEIVVSCCSGRGAELSHVSYVNSIATWRGGTHVNYILEQVVSSVHVYLSQNHPDLDIEEKHVRPHVWLLVSATIENPSFDSQAKEALVTPVKDFGSKCVLSADFLANVIAHTEIVESVLAAAKGRQTKAFDKVKVPTVGTGAGKRLLIPKLEDANLAGSKRWKECTLILTEGDSAKALAVAGLSEVGRDFYGVYPLRGKLINARTASSTQVQNNKEITAIRSILGLQHGKVYNEGTNSGKAGGNLRYGKVMLMTDQDYDGSHIKGLFFNILHHYWPSLLERNDFVAEFVTPLIKVKPIDASEDSTKIPTGKRPSRSKKSEFSFFTVQEYEAWRAKVGSMAGWRVKYYKGLGTSTAQEGREYFQNLPRHRISLLWKGKEDGEALSLAFDDDAEPRREWLSATPAHEAAHVDHSKGILTYRDFVHKELIQYSHASLRRSIPSVLDGLKHGQRKVLFACFKRKLTREMKVAQLSGYVAEQTAYHHGEASLHATIVNMAQDFVGSNNLPLLHPAGQFGTRLQGGDDAASARYIFTRLSSHTRTLFREPDDELLDYQEEDGVSIEPLQYVPIIPIILVNGTQGIGTGWSTFVPTYNPLHIIDAVETRIQGQPVEALTPWYAGFKGQIEPTNTGFVTTGVLEEIDDESVRVTELPVNRWTENFKAHLDTLCAEGKLKGYSEHHTESTVNFVVVLSPEVLKDKAEPVGVASKLLRMQTKISTQNMVAFDPSGKLKRYTDPREMIDDFVPVRLALYIRRKRMQECRLAYDLGRLRNKVRFLTMVAKEELALGGRTRKQLEADLEQRGFETEADIFANTIGRADEDDDGNVNDPHVPESDESVEDSDEDPGDIDGDDGAAEEGTPGSDTTRPPAAAAVKPPPGGYGYLLSMPMYSATEERLEELDREAKGKEAELAALQALTPEDIWFSELGELRAQVEEALAARGAEPPQPKAKRRPKR